MRRPEQHQAKRQNRHFRVRHAIVSSQYPSMCWKKESGKKNTQYGLNSRFVEVCIRPSRQAGRFKAWLMEPQGRQDDALSCRG